MFATDPRLPGKHLELPYVPPPQREIEIPTSSIDRKTLFTRTWLAPPMVNALWMQAELGHVSVAEVAAGTETYGESSFLLGARVGGRPLTWKSNAFGPVLTDDLSGAFAFGMTVDFEEATTGGVLAASATYSLGAGYRSRAFGGIVAGVRPTASVLYIDSAAAIGTAVPLFARIDVPFGNGSLAVDGYGASLAGKAHTGLAVHIAWRGKSRKQHTRFLTFRYETRDLDVNVNDMDLPGVSSTMITSTFGIGL